MPKLSIQCVVRLHLTPFKSPVLQLRVNSLLYHTTLKGINNYIILNHKSRIWSRITNTIVPDSHGSISKKHFAGCNCPPNVLCKVGQLINCSISVRRAWVRQEKTKFLNSICNSESEKKDHARTLDNCLERISDFNFCSTSKLINLDSYFQDSCASPPTLEKGSSLTQNLANLASEFSCAFAPIVAALIHKQSGKRLFVESQGLSSHTRKTPDSLGQYTRHIMHNEKIITLSQYKEILVSEISEITCLTKDYKENPHNFVFHVLKIGKAYCSEAKRRALVKKLSIKAGVFAYNYSYYTNKKYVFKDLLRAQKKSRLFCNTEIPLTMPVYLGYPDCIETETFYINTTYKNVAQAAYINCRCKNRIVYGLFSEEKEYLNWCLPSRHEFNAINKAKLTTLNGKTIKSNNLVALKRKFHFKLRLQQKCNSKLRLKQKFKAKLTNLVSFNSQFAGLNYKLNDIKLMYFLVSAQTFPIYAVSLKVTNINTLSCVKLMPFLKSFEICVLSFKQTIILKVTLSSQKLLQLWKCSSIYILSLSKRGFAFLLVGVLLFSWGCSLRNTYNSGNIGHLGRACTAQVYAITSEISNLAINLNRSDYIDVTTFRARKAGYPVVLAAVTLSSSRVVKPQIQSRDGLVVATCVPYRTQTQTKQSPWLTKHSAPSSPSFYFLKSRFVQSSTRMPNVVASATAKKLISPNCENLPQAVFFDPLHQGLKNYDRQLLPYVFYNGPQIITDPVRVGHFNRESERHEKNRDACILSKFNSQNEMRVKMGMEALVFNLHQQREDSIYNFLRTQYGCAMDHIDKNKPYLYLNVSLLTTESYVGITQGGPTDAKGKGGNSRATVHTKSNYNKDSKHVQVQLASCRTDSQGKPATLLHIPIYGIIHSEAKAQMSLDHKVFFDENNIMNESFYRTAPEIHKDFMLFIERFLTHLWGFDSLIIDGQIYPRILNGTNNPHPIATDQRQANIAQRAENLRAGEENLKEIEKRYRESQFLDDLPLEVEVLEIAKREYKIAKARGSGLGKSHTFDEALLAQTKLLAPILQPQIPLPPFPEISLPLTETESSLTPAKTDSSIKNRSISLPNPLRENNGTIMIKRPGSLVETGTSYKDVVKYGGVSKELDKAFPQVASRALSQLTPSALMTTPLAIKGSNSVTEQIPKKANIAPLKNKKNASEGADLPK